MCRRPMRRGTPRDLAVAIVLAVVATSSRARGEACEVSSTRAPVTPAWTAAIERTRALVRGDRECLRIEIHGDGEHVRLVFTTSDGRIAKRTLADASELESAVEALLVAWTPPAADEPAPAAEDASRVETPVAASPLLATNDLQPAAQEPDRAPARAHPSPQLLAGVTAGARASAPGDTVAAVGQLFAGVTFGKIELAAYGRLEMEHALPDADSRPRTKLGAIGGGPMLGYRHDAGFATLVFGLRAGVFEVEAERPRARGGGTARAGESYVDPRVGLYAGAVFFDRAHVRFRVQVEGDAGFVAQRPDLVGDAVLARWTAGASLGVELGGLP